MQTAPRQKMIALCVAALLASVMLGADLVCAQSNRQAKDAWSGLRADAPQGTLWRKGLSPEALARRVQAQPTQPAAGAQRRKTAPAAQDSVPTRRKSPPPTWRGNTPEQREAMRIRASVPERSIAPQHPSSKPLPINGCVEDRSSSWHADPNRPSDAGEMVFADRRQTITGMVGYSDSRVSFGVGPEITIDDGHAASLMRSTGGSPAPSGDNGDHKEKSTPPPVDVGLGMRFRLGF